jgi:hypothetical protein
VPIPSLCSDARHPATTIQGFTVGRAGALGNDSWCMFENLLALCRFVFPKKRRVTPPQAVESNTVIPSPMGARIQRSAQYRASPFRTRPIASLRQRLAIHRRRPRYDSWQGQFARRWPSAAYATCRGAHKSVAAPRMIVGRSELTSRFGSCSDRCPTTPECVGMWSICGDVCELI